MGEKPTNRHFISRPGGKGRSQRADIKIVLLLSLSVLVFLTDQVPTLLCIYCTVVSLLVLAGTGWKRLLIWFAFSVVALWTFVLTQSVFYPYYPRTLFFEIIPAETPLLGALTGGVAVYWEGIVYGAVQSLRFLILITAGLTVVWTTSAQEMLRGLRRLGLPYPLAFMVTTAVRFIPTVGKEAGIVLSAMRTRGYRMHPLKPWRYLTAMAHSLTPILFRNMRRAGLLADSVETRGFNAVHNQPATEGGLKTASGDTRRASRDLPDNAGRWLPRRFFVVFIPLVTLALLAAKVVTIAAREGIFYSDNLIWIYDVVEAVL